jgi:A/G-specific adenine glycosylase
MYFSQQIIRWYNRNHRSLPWRETHDPYVIWLSEVILQQTRVNQGTPYFYKFTENYPNIESFASAPEEEVLRHWQGLGYYSRARNMLKTAKLIMQEHAGIFPSTYDDLIKLPGIGEYTASAIASFSINEPKAVVDGNVSRVLARYFGIEEAINSSKGKRQFSQLAQEVLDKDNAGIHNQAMMEFGALQCKPQNPYCDTCPLQQSCFAYQNNLVNKLPIKIKAGKSRNRYFNYFVIREDDAILIQRRKEGDIWEGLFELPLIETSLSLNDAEIKLSKEFKEFFGEQAEIIYSSALTKHILSHQNIHARFFEIINIQKDTLKNRDWNYVLIKDLDKLAKSKLIFSFMDIYFNKQI